MCTDIRWVIPVHKLDTYIFDSSDQFLKRSGKGRTPISDSAVKVVKALEEHPYLNVLQLAGAAKLAISQADAAVSELKKLGLIKAENSAGKRLRYSLDEKALNERLQAA
jgi:DNA-binding MarR family transcriptional regulator